MKTTYLITRETTRLGIGCVLGRGKYFQSMSTKWFNMVFESLCEPCNIEESMDIIIFPSF